jgi:hypothetical protein
MIPATYRRRGPNQPVIYGLPPVGKQDVFNCGNRVCGHISGFVVERSSFRALMGVARQLLGILAA